MAVECQVHYAEYKSPRAKGYAADRKQIQQGDCSSVERAVKVFSSHAVECKSLTQLHCRQCVRVCVHVFFKFDLCSEKLKEGGQARQRL